ncbi:2,3-bisphosphoglycerate-dependent phosphoglycerate mutase [Sphingobacterium faecale]|uniref:2,3-bisphosphoglycerate-dependent phosphoglycerate mutase n=1 Tax=Sphingobacterium faecale TaxID=2803775 RepID=A0ABS1QXT1_9SPHI|nr:2,3-diphosphoglycerate-dependent phosphoglycerate mutase [Sphingobacterium faecale]MBL1407237.1 2,3-diphosphoglycerate-dependent phosphoglycerate mutase [Sphingobacterium faecale]
MSKLFLVRHGQSQWNLENRFTGGQDIDLTELGKQEARHAGQQLQEQKIDIAFSSKLVRARRTLAMMLEEMDRLTIPIMTTACLNERSYGMLEGLNKAETVLKYGEAQVQEWRRSFDVIPPGGESLKDTHDRVIPYFKKYIAPELASGKNVLIVAHGNSLRALIMFLEHISSSEIMKREIATGVPLYYEVKDAYFKRREALLSKSLLKTATHG